MPVHVGYDVVLHVIPDVARVLVLAAPYRRVPLDAVGELFSIRRIFKPTKRPNHRGEVEHLDVLVLLEERRHLDVGEILGGSGVDSVIVTVSFASSSESAKTVIPIVPVVLPALIVNVPLVAV